MSKNDDSSQELAIQQQISLAAEQLSAQYCFSGDDVPESIDSAAPRARRIIRALRSLVELMIPVRGEDQFSDANALDAWFQVKLRDAWSTLLPEIERSIPYRWLGRAAQTEGPPEEEDPKAVSIEVMKTFLSKLPLIRSKVVDDLQAAYDGDPAALTFAELKLSNLGLTAVVSYRIAHEFYLLNVPIVPRVMSEWTHSKTGVDIHPGAQIGSSFFIDHATGVVVGETAVIGDRVKLYQGVTLGARSFARDEHGNPVKHVRRHPTIEDDVVIFSNTTILGGDTVIGKGSTIGGNVFLTASVPAGSVVLRGAEGPVIKSKLRD